MPRLLLPPRRADLLLVLLLAGSAALGFAVAPTKQYSFDAVSYAWQIEQFAATRRLAWLLHPHHLLFNSVGYLWWRLAHFFFARPLEAQQFLNALAGGASVGLCFLLVRQATGQRLLALGVSVLLWASAGLWLVATDGGIYAPALALCLGALCLAFRMLEQPSAGLAVALGATTAAACLIHQMHALLAPAALAAPLLARGLPWRAQLRLLLLTGGACGILLLGAYSIAAAALGHASPRAFFLWISSYARDGRWWKLDDIPGNLRLDGKALVGDFAIDPEGRVAAAVGAHGLLLALLAAGIAALCCRAAARRGRELLLGALWVLPYAAFFTVWVPGYFAYWLPVAIGLLLVLCLALDGSLAHARRPLPGVAVPAAATFLFCLAAGGLAIANAPDLRRGELAAGNPMLEIAADISAHTRGADPETGRPRDLILMAGAGDYGAAEVYVLYFADRHVVTLANMLKHEGPQAGFSVAHALARLRDVIVFRWRAGAQVYALSDVTSSRSAFEALPGRELSRPQFRAFLAQFTRQPAFQARGRPVTRIAPSATVSPAMRTSEPEPPHDSDRPTF